MESAPSPRASAMKAASSDKTASPKTGPSKAVSFPAGGVSPMMLGREKEQGDSFTLDGPPAKPSPAQHTHNTPGSPRLHRKKLRTRASRHSSEGLASPLLKALTSPDSEKSDTTEKKHHRHHRGSHSSSHHASEALVSQLKAWLRSEKARRAKRRVKRATGKKMTRPSSAENGAPPDDASDASDGSAALDDLEGILRHMNINVHDYAADRIPSAVRRRTSSIKKLRRPSSVAVSTATDTDVDEALVPSCDAWLDNSQACAYSGGGSDTGSRRPSKLEEGDKEKEAWATFKNEILRLTHTLGIKGWRRLPFERSNEIRVERLSGALTNAVYEVSPPKELPHTNGSTNNLQHPKKPPRSKLLLRIYGPQVEHLIDRDAELQILQRLARKQIGPRLLGTFANGRFEEFFNARPLTAQEMRQPETSKKIAKRMRELHEGIELLPPEREAGPFVWQNWDKWVDRVEQTMTWLDHQILSGRQGSITSGLDAWKRRGLVCGVEWPVFRKTVERYRQHLENQYGSAKKVNDNLVFAHNDAQYGNILRMMPSGESPLVRPENEHRQLVVIDFEYANANLPGLEFANHFTEWCYNYHDAAPHACNTSGYPKPEEQHRFIHAYVSHRPSFSHCNSTSTENLSAPSTPNQHPTLIRNTSSISNFMLDARNPQGQPRDLESLNAAEDGVVETEVQQLLRETRLWRLANHAQWVAWGIVQATIPDLPDFAPGPLTPAVEAAMESLGGGSSISTSRTTDSETKTGKVTDGAVVEEPEGMEVNGHGNDAVMSGDEKRNSSHEDKRPEEGGDEEFDYLGYAQERALFFWGDAVGLGLVKLEELPEALRKRIKIVEY